ncbi:MAG: CPBP family intramembrane metalloprotease [Prolixibacteraceae bacterium]|jgi:membrane protease YdiL (CAAX protease family)|nr:CPBP family intramembrane metalloprotease [Prolixibacteraceae bacterium]
MSSSSSNKGTTWYIVIVLSISFLFAGLYYLIFPERDKIPYTIMAVLYMFMPFLTVLFVDKVILKKKGFKSWALNFKPNWWYLAAWPAFVIVAFLVLAINLLWPGISFSADMIGFWDRMADQLSPEQIEAQKMQLENLPIPFLPLTLIQALIGGLTINAIAAFGEEVGWRGFLVREFKHLKFWNAALKIGILWGIWHAPLILMGHNYPEHNLLGVGMMTIFCILISPLFLFVRIKTHSVIAASIMHGTLNASAGIPIMYLVGGNDLTIGFTGFAGFITLALLIGIIIIYDLKFSKKSITNKTILEGVKN